MALAFLVDGQHGKTRLAASLTARSRLPKGRGEAILDLVVVLGLDELAQKCRQKRRVPARPADHSELAASVWSGSPVGAHDGDQSRVIHGRA